MYLSARKGLSVAWFLFHGSTFFVCRVWLNKKKHASHDNLSRDQQKHSPPPSNSFIISKKLSSLVFILLWFFLILEHAPFWIGLNDLETTGIYKWSGSGSVATTLIWNFNQPDGGDQHCVFKLLLKTWHDRKCSLPVGSVCQASLNTCPWFEMGNIVHSTASTHILYLYDIKYQNKMTKPTLVNIYVFYWSLAVGSATWSKCLLSHLGVVGLILGHDSYTIFNRIILVYIE